MARADDMLDPLLKVIEDLAGMRPRLLRGRSAPGPDFTVRLGDRTLLIEARGQARAADVAAAAAAAKRRSAEGGAQAVPVVVVPYMGPVGAQICKDLGVGFIDLSGNANVVAPPLVLRISGRPNLFLKRGRPSSVFAPAGSRIAHLMLLDPARWWKQHEIATAVDLGPGYVSRVCKRLESDGLIERNEHRALRARDPALLFHAWRERYEFMSHDITMGHLPSRSGEELAGKLSLAFSRNRVDHAFTGLAAAWRLAPFAAFRLVTVYIRDAVSESVLAPLGWRDDEDGANLWLVRPRDPGVFQGAGEVDGLRCVSAVQTYLDLADLPERATEAAEHLKERRLPWM